MIARIFFSFFVLVSLSACATGARTGAMTAAVSGSSIIAETSTLKKSMIVADVTGGKETNPLWVSNVGNVEFKGALEQSLTLHAMLDTVTPRYKLEVKLVELDQPFGGFDMTVGSRVFYRLGEVGTNEMVYQTEITCEYTAKLSDAFLGYERLRLANEGAIKKNISLFIEALTAEFRKREAAAAPVANTITTGTSGS